MLIFSELLQHIVMWQSCMCILSAFCFYLNTFTMLNFMSFVKYKTDNVDDNTIIFIIHVHCTCIFNFVAFLVRKKPVVASRWRLFIWPRSGKLQFTLYEIHSESSRLTGSQGGFVGLICNLCGDQWSVISLTLRVRQFSKSSIMGQ